MSVTSFFVKKKYKDPVYGAILGKKLFYYVIDNEFKKSYSEDEALEFEEIYNFYGYHLGVDTFAIFHTTHVESVDPGKIVVNEGDTDFAITLSCNMEKLENGHLWYKFGVDYNNSC